MAEENKYNILIEAGADFVLPWYWYDSNGNPVNLTGATIEGQLRHFAEDTSFVEFVCTHNGAGGRITITLPNEITGNLSWTSGVYDVFVTPAGGLRTKLLEGQAEIHHNVTKPVDGTFLYMVGIATWNDLPAVGNTSRLYFTYDERRIYRWNGTNYIATATGNGIRSIDFIEHVDEFSDKYRVTFDDLTTWDYIVTSKGIDYIEKVGSTGTPKTGVIDQYRIHFNNSTTHDYYVTNGRAFDVKTSYDSTQAYEYLDMVRVNGATYVAVQDVPANTSISDTDYWLKIFAPLTIGTVTTVSADTGASASIGGTPDAPKLNLSIPRGVAGNESIDDTKGEGDTDYVWSADKTYNTDHAIGYIPVTITNGIYIKTNGDEASSSGSCATDFIPVVSGVKYKVSNLNLTGVRSICTYNKNKVFVKKIASGTSDKYIEYSVEENECYIRATGNSGVAPVVRTIDIAGLINSTKPIIDRNNSSIGNTIITSSITNGKYIKYSDGSVDTDQGSCATDFIPVAVGEKVFIEKLYLSGVRSICVYSSDKTFVKSLIRSSSDKTYEYTVEKGVSYIRATGVSGVAPTFTFSDIAKSLCQISSNDSCYVATTGNDETGNGSAEMPFASVTKAIQSGYSKILISSGIYYQNINLKLAKGKHIEIKNITMDGRVIFRSSNRMVTNAAETVSGYTKVKSCEYTQSLDGLWIFQEGVPYGLIDDSERHPSQRGKEYRCDDTFISAVSSNNLSDALTEIETSDDFLFYHDTDNSTLYFSSPQEVSDDNPITVGRGGELFVNADRTMSITCTGIEAEYLQFNVKFFSKAEIIDCKSSKSAGDGCFTYNMGIGVKFTRCEASLNKSGNTGDGFNGHANTTGDPFAKKVTCELVDCWSHDNNDDGYSDHECSETVIRGGLYEYNKKGGVTPSFGSHCSCFGVYSRKNYNGFYYLGEATGAEGGKYGQLICYNCIAEANDKGSSNDKNGFTVQSTGNRMILVNCKSINNATHYRARENTRITMIDCGAYGDGIAIAGAGTIDIKNTVLVE